jgi:hypothetical protein
MIKPTNGRVVLFTPHLDDTSGLMCIDRTPLASIVAHVWSDRLVNLVVFDSRGQSFPFNCVTLLQDDDIAPDAGRFCAWMDYQKGQAAKTEAAEARVSKSAVY